MCELGEQQTIVKRLLINMKNKILLKGMIRMDYNKLNWILDNPKFRVFFC